MATNTLTDRAIKALAPKAKPYKRFDGGGLYLQVLPSGTKTWRLSYRVDGTEQTETFGQYPLITLAAARDMREMFKRKLAAGEVLEERQQIAAAAAEAARPQMEFKAACETYWQGRTDVTDKYRTNALRGLEMYLWPALGARTIRSITRADLLAAFNKMNDAKLFDYVRKVRIWASHVWDWATEQGHADFNPCEQINPRKAFGHATVAHFAALELRDVPTLWKRLHIEPRILSVLACMMLAYTWVRTKELRSMKWEHIDADGVWRVPGSVLGKTKKDHLVPLSRQALALLDELRALTGARASDYVFPASHRIDRAMSDSTVLMLLYRLGYKGEMTGHGWRSVGSTWANELGYDDDAIERQLAHVEKDKVRAIYNRAQYLQQRREILQAWADWLDACLEQVDAVGAQRGDAPALLLQRQANVGGGQLLVSDVAREGAAAAV